MSSYYKILGARSRRSGMPRSNASANSNASSGSTTLSSIVVTATDGAEIVDVTPDIPQTCNPKFLATKLKTVTEMKQDMNLLMTHPNANFPNLFRNILLRTKQ